MYNIIKIDKDYITNYSLEIHPFSTPYNSYRNYFSAQFKYDLPIVYPYTFKQLLRIPTSAFYSVKQDIMHGSINTNLYPIAVRYVTADSKYLIERPPFQIPVDFRIGNAHSGAEKVPQFNIWVPWTSTIIDLSIPDSNTLSKTRIFFNDGPLYSIEDPVIPCDLPNSYSNGSICFSNSLSEINNVLDEQSVLSSDVSYIYNYVFNNYMMGGWNSDLTPVFSSYGYHGGIDTSDLHMYSEYVNPSPERKARIISTFAGTSYEVIAKRILNSKSHFTNIRSLPKMYFRDLIIRSSFTLQETLQYVSDIKTLNDRRLNKLNGSSSSKRANVNLLSVLHSETKINSYSDTGYNAAASYILNRVIQNPNIASVTEYTYDTYTGHIVVPPNQAYSKYVNNISHIIHAKSINTLTDQILNNYISGTLKSAKNIIFSYESLDEDSSRFVGAFDFVEQSASEILFPYFDQMVSNINLSSIKDPSVKSIADLNQTMSILQTLTA